MYSTSHATFTRTACNDSSLQAVVVCVDNSDYSRNEDTERHYVTSHGPSPSRLDVQLNSLRGVIQDLEEGFLISIMALSGQRGPEVKCYPTTDKQQLLEALDSIDFAKSGEECHLFAGLRLGQMILHQRCLKASSLRLMVFLASSSLQEEVPTLPQLKALESFGKTHNISLDYFTFPEVFPSSSSSSSFLATSFCRFPSSWTPTLLSLFALGSRHEVVSTTQVYRVLSLLYKEVTFRVRHVSSSSSTTSSSPSLPPTPAFKQHKHELPKVALSSELLSKLGMGMGASSRTGLGTRNCSREALFPSKVRVRHAGLQVNPTNRSLVFFRKPTSIKYEVLLKFNAGLLRLDHGILFPEPKKGQIVIVKETSGISLKWFDRTNGRLGLAINFQARGGAFEKIEKCTQSQVYVLTLSGVNQQFFFWLQQKSEPVPTHVPDFPNNENFVSYCNQLLNQNNTLRQVRIYGSSDLSNFIKNYKQSYFLSLMTHPPSTSASTRTNNCLRVTPVPLTEQHSSPTPPLFASSSSSSPFSPSPSSVSSENSSSLKTTVSESCHSSPSSPTIASRPLSSFLQSSISAPVTPSSSPSSPQPLVNLISSIPNYMAWQAVPENENEEGKEADEGDEEEAEDEETEAEEEEEEEEEDDESQHQQQQQQQEATVITRTHSPHLDS